MANVKISQLTVGEAGPETYIPTYDAGVNETRKVSMDGIVEMVKKSLGYLEKPLVKCRHCGQWGAVYCACAYCGAPIDP